VMNHPVKPASRSKKLVAVNTQFPTRKLYTVNPTEAAVWPTKSHRETPRGERSFTCVRICRMIVARRINELIQPMSSLIRRPCACNGHAVRERVELGLLCCQGRKDERHLRYRAEQDHSQREGERAAVALASQ
jgi:hypothetical protein